MGGAQESCYSWAGNEYCACMVGVGVERNERYRDSDLDLTGLTKQGPIIFLCFGDIDVQYVTGLDLVSSQQINF